MRHPEAIRTNPDNIPSRITHIWNDLDPEEGVDVVLGVQTFQHPMAVPRVEVEGSQDLPASEVVDDLDERLLAVDLDEAELHASLQHGNINHKNNEIPIGATGLVVVGGD